MKGTCAITVTEKWCKAWSPAPPLGPPSRGIQSMESMAEKSKSISKVSLVLPDLTKSHPVSYTSLSQGDLLDPVSSSMIIFLSFDMQETRKITFF